MENNLEKIFLAYWNCVLQESNEAALNLRTQSNTPGPIPLLTPERLTLPIIERLEQRKEFRDLVTETLGSEPQHVLTRLAWTPVHHFLRQSGLYTDALGQAFYGTPPRFAEPGRHYAQQLRKETHSVTYLAPIQLVSFESSLNCIDCGHFQIRCLSALELDEIVNNPARIAFYPESEIDTERLSKYQHIVYVREEPLRGTASAGLDHWTGVIRPGGRVLDWTLNDPRLAPIQNCLRCLGLYDWEDVFFQAGNLPQLPVVYTDRGVITMPHPFVPFVLRIPQSEIYPPDLCPSLDSMLGNPTIRTPSCEISMEGPPVWKFNPEAAVDFSNRMKGYSNLLERLENTSYQAWVHVMTGRLAKSFGRTTSDQIVDHVIAIEAALGDKSRGAGAGIKDRLGALAGSLSKEELKKLRRDVDEIYEIRSRIVHGSIGNPAPRDIRATLVARKLSRRSVRDVLYYVARASTYLDKHNLTANRETLLRALDYAGASERQALGSLIRDWPNLESGECDSEGTVGQDIDETAAAYGLFQVVFADLTDHLAVATFSLRQRAEPNLAFETVFQQGFKETLKQLKRALRQFEGQTSEPDSLDAVRKACDDMSTLAAWRNGRVHARVRLTEHGYVLYDRQGRRLKMTHAQVKKNIQLASRVMTQLEGHMPHLVPSLNLEDEIRRLLSTLPEPSETEECSHEKPR